MLIPALAADCARLLAIAATPHPPACAPRASRLRVGCGIAPGRRDRARVLATEIHCIAAQPEALSRYAGSLAREALGIVATTGPLRLIRALEALARAGDAAERAEAEAGLQVRMAAFRGELAADAQREASGQGAGLSYHDAWKRRAG